MFAAILQWNVLSLVLGSWVPSLGISVSGAETGPLVVLASFPEFLVALALLFPVSSLLGAVYLALIAAEVQERTLTWEVLAPRALRLAARLMGLVGLMLVLTVIPIAVTALMLAMAPPLGFLLFLLSVVALLWLMFYVFFIVDGLALVRQSLPKVIRLTLDVMHSNLGSLLGFFCLYWLILLGTGIIWGVMLDVKILNIGVGRVFATLGNAYVGTWVTIAMFMYVWNRVLLRRAETAAA